MAKFRIPKHWIYEFAEKVLREAGVEQDAIETDLEAFIYEAGEKDWEEGDYYFYIDVEED